MIIAYLQPLLLSSNPSEPLCFIILAHLCYYRPSTTLSWLFFIFWYALHAKLAASSFHGLPFVVTQSPYLDWTGT